MPESRSEVQPSAEPRFSLRGLEARGWGTLPYVFIVIVLVALVVVPVLVDRWLHAVRRVVIERIDPAVWESAELAHLLADQTIAIVRHAEGSTPGALDTYAEARQRQATAVERIGTLTHGLNPEVDRSLAAYRASLEEWHAVHDALLAGQLDRDAYLALQPEQIERIEAMAAAGAEFRSALRDEMRARRELVSTVETVSMGGTAILALLALIAALVVRRLERRRQRLATELGRYADEQTVLAEIAGTLGGARRREEVLERIADGAVTLTRAFGAYIERATGPPAAEPYVEIVATAGLGVPPDGTRAPYSGSVTEEILERHVPARIHELDRIGEAIAPYLRGRCLDCAGLVVPFISEGELLGALILLRDARQAPFDEVEIGSARTLGDLGSVALRRILIQDRTERERRERAALLESTADGIYGLDREGRCTFINPAAAERLGYGPNELIGRDMHEAIHHSRPDGSPYPRSESSVLRALEERRTIRSDDEVYWRKDGTSFPIEFTAAPIIENDEVEGMVVAFRDATERRLAEQERARLLAREREARARAERNAQKEIALREAIEAVSEHFTVEDIFHQIAESAVTATGSTGSIVERIDVEPGQVIVVSGTGETTPLIDTRVPYHGSLAEYVIERGRTEVVLDLSRPGYPVEDHILENFAAGSALVVPLLDAGEAIGALFLIRGPDQTPYRPDEVARARTFADLAALAFRKVHLLEDSERRREELERVMESRSRLMRGFSHDVKNPLGAADGHAHLLEEGMVGDLEPEQHESVARIRRSIRTALDLIDDLLELARAETGQMSIRRQSTDLREVAHELGETYRSQAEAAGIELNITIPRELPIIESDVDRVRQILGNLLSNAVKYSESGARIDVTVEQRRDGQPPGPGDWLTVAVRDTGPGIPEEKLNHLFQEFTRLDRSGTEGAGLGLAISRNIARLLGGEVTAESKTGEGSTFTLWLPCGAAGRRRTGATGTGTGMGEDGGEGDEEGQKRPEPSPNPNA